MMMRRMMVHVNRCRTRLSILALLPLVLFRYSLVGRDTRGVSTGMDILLSRGGSRRPRASLSVVRLTHTGVAKTTAKKLNFCTYISCYFRVYEHLFLHIHGPFVTSGVSYTPYIKRVADLGSTLQRRMIPYRKTPSSCPLRDCKHQLSSCTLNLCTYVSLYTRASLEFSVCE